MNVNNKIYLLRDMSCTETPYIIKIKTKTSIDEARKHFVPKYEIEGYTVFHKDRINSTGGYLLFIEDTYDATIAV